MPPPGHGVHHYHFKLYALDARLDLPPGSTKKQLLDAMKGHVLGEAELVGTYGANADRRRHLSERSIVVLIAWVVMVTILLTTFAQAQSPPADGLVRDRYGAIIRGDQNAKKLALVFTGDEYGESLEPILDTLKPRKLQAAFFVTGNFLRSRRCDRC